MPLPFLLKCVRGSLEASFSSSVHSRSHSSSVYTSPDWRKGKLVQEAASVTCPHLLLPQRQQYQATQVGLSPVRTQTGHICECPLIVTCMYFQKFQPLISELESPPIIKVIPGCV